MKIPFLNVSKIAVAALLLFFVGCAHQQHQAGQAGQSGAALEPVSSDAVDSTGSQLLAVLGEGKGGATASLHFLERVHDEWQLRHGPLPAMLGSKGLAAPGPGDKPDLPPPGGGAPEDVEPPAASAGLEAEIRGKLADATEPLVERRGPDGFFAMAVPVPKAVELEMHAKRTWRTGCPVPIGDLSYLVLVHWGHDGKPRIGELVMHRKLAQATVEAFADLYALRFPIEKMELIERYDGDDHRSMEANNTSAFNCREVSGRPGVLSKHSYGSALDINPVQNPYVVPKNEVLRALGWKGAEEKAGFLEKLGYSKGGAIESFCSEELANCKISPASGAPYSDRTRPAPGLIVDGPVVNAFTSRGFQWGGVWRNELDYQHFDVKPERLR